jgi:folate-binding protein YgfZ
MLREMQKLSGAVFSESGDIPLSFNNEEIAIKSSQNGVAIYDQSHWGRLEISDSDRIRFIHNQSTNNFNNLQPDQGCDTVFVTSTARTIDLATVYLTEEVAIILVSPHRREYLLNWLDRYIFPMDKIKLRDISPQTACFSLIGPDSATLLGKIGLNPPTEGYANHHLQKINDLEVRVAQGTSLGQTGFTLIVNSADAPQLWQNFIALGAIPLGDQTWEKLRILQGRPFPDAELTNDYNPLEAGLLHTISYEKGCYIGQETIARLNTYKGVKQHLWGVKLNSFVVPDTVITLESEKIGKLTSCTETPDGAFGLAYIKTKAGTEGLTVAIGETTGILVTLPRA